MWSAWPYMIAPVPSSFHLVNYQLKMLRSYLENPDLHFKASRNPELVGGAFVGIEPERVGEVRRLLEETERRLADNVALVQSIESFQRRLLAEARGTGLAPFYAQLPDELRGLVELVYDYHNRPSLRLFENLLYASRFYTEDLQALRVSRLEEDQARPFVINTPRLPADDQLHWQVAYDDPRVDALFGLDSTPRGLADIRDALGLGAGEMETLRPLLSADPRPLPETWRQKGVRIRYFGHACILIEWDGISILTDPYVPVRPARGGPERLSYQDLPARIDYALVTHLHHDHFALETLLRLRHRIGHVVVPKSAGMLYGDVSLKLMCRRLGFKRVVELDALESIALPDGEIVGLPFLGEHGDLAHSKTAYIVRAGRERIMVGADSDCLDRALYVNVRAALGPIETVFLGTESVGAPLSWIYGSLLSAPPQRDHNESRRQHGSDARAALEILEAVGAKRIYNYAMGLEPWLEHILGLGLHEDAPQWQASERLLSCARRRGLLAVERPFCKHEIHLGEAAASQTAAGPDAGAAEPAESSPPADGKGGGGATLSAVQEHLLRTSAAGELPARNVCAVLTFKGDLRTEALERSLSAIHDRHEVLRGRCLSARGVPTGIGTTDSPVELLTADLSAEDEPVRAAEAARRAAAGVEFDLSRGPLWRCLLLRLSAEDYVLVLTLHSLAGDERSGEVIARELNEHYRAYSTGDDAEPSAALPFQFAEMAARERARLESDREGPAYWAKQLEGGAPPLSAPAGASAPGPETGRTRRLPVELPPDLLRGLKKLAESHASRLGEVLAASLLTLFHHHTGEEYIPLATLVENRDAEGADRLVGCFASTLVLCTDLSGNPTFLNLLRRVGDVSARARERGHWSWEALAGVGRLADRFASQPPFRLMLILKESPVQSSPRNAFVLREVETVGSREAELTVILQEKEGALAGVFEYDPSHMGDETAAALVRHLTSVVRAAVSNPDQTLAELLTGDTETEDDFFFPVSPDAPDDTEPHFIL
jgi:L-ascorbate metabolism protein UlaG (beta-lactamase superfamily)